MGDCTTQASYIAALRERGFDGLCCPDEPCGCSLDDVAPCGMAFDPDTKDGWKDYCDPAHRFDCIGGQACAHACDLGAVPGGDCFCLSTDGPRRREPEPEIDIYAEPGLSSLRTLVKGEPEWAVNRLVHERGKRHAAEADADALDHIIRHVLIGHIWNTAWSWDEVAEMYADFVANREAPDA